MCRPASFVLTEHDVFWRTDDNTDSHESIIRTARLEDNTMPPEILRVEIVPPGAEASPDWHAPFNQWIWIVDQDVMPPWHDSIRDEMRARAVLPEWYAACVIASGEHAESEATTRYIVGGTVSEIRGGTVSVIWGGTVSVIWGGTVSAIRGGTVSVIMGNATAVLYRSGVILSASQDAVIVDRTVSPPRCYVGSLPEAAQ